MFLVLVLGHTHKVGLVNVYPLQYGYLKCRSVKVMPLHHNNTDSVNHMSVDFAVTLAKAHIYFTKQNKMPT